MNEVVEIIKMLTAEQWAQAIILGVAVGIGMGIITAILRWLFG